MEWCFVFVFANFHLRREGHAVKSFEVWVENLFPVSDPVTWNGNQFRSLHKTTGANHDVSLWGDEKTRVYGKSHEQWNYAAKLDIFMIAHSLFNEHYKVSNLTGIVAWSALGKRKLTSEKGLFSKANHCFSQFLTVGAVGELGRIEGCSHPVMISAGQPKGWNPCVLDGGSWLTLRWLLSSFKVSWRISIFSNDSPCGQTSWSPRWK